MPRHPDRLDDLHAQLLADARQQPDYAAGAVTSISAYSEGAEHALDSVRLQGYTLPTPLVIPDRHDLAFALFDADNGRRTTEQNRADWIYLSTQQKGRQYAFILADVAIAEFKRANS